MIYNGDCIEFMKSMPLVTLTLTDIPYGVVNRKSNGLQTLDRKDADVVTFDLQEFLASVIRVTSGSIYIFCSTEQVSEIRETLVRNRLSTRLGIWEKTNPSPMNGQYIWLSGIECCVYGKKPRATFNEHCKNTVWRHPLVSRKRHPTEKPLKLFKYLVETSSNPGDTVFDPCMGCGTAGEAALSQGRNFIGCELNEAYFKIAQERLNNFKKV